MWLYFGEGGLDFQGLRQYRDYTSQATGQLFVWLLWRPLQTADPKPITLQRKALDLGEDYNTCKAVIAHQMQKSWKDTLILVWGLADCVASSKWH